MVALKMEAKLEQTTLSRYRHWWGSETKEEKQKDCGGEVKMTESKEECNDFQESRKWLPDYPYMALLPALASVS